MKEWITKPRRLAGRTLREALLYPQMAVAPKSRRLIFLPSSGREQSGLLRAYLVAENLKKSGWAPLVLPKHLNARQRNRILNLYDPDLVILQMCRHPLNRMEHLEGRPLILDVDDADFLDDGLSDVMRNVACNAKGVICGSGFIQDWAATHNHNAEVIWTGSPVTPGPWPAHAERQRIVTWAQANPIAAEEEFDFIEDVVIQAQRRTAPFRFRLYGWNWPQDHPRLDRLRQEDIDLELFGPLPYNAFLASLRDVSVGLSAIVSSHFSQGKSFGKLLGYLDAKVPVICSDAADHSAFFTSRTGVVSNDKATWVKELVSLLDSPDRRQDMSDLAYQEYITHLDIAAMSRKVSDFLARTLTK